MELLELEKPAGKGLAVLAELPSLQSLSLADASVPKGLSHLASADDVMFDRCKMARLPTLPKAKRLYLFGVKTADLSALTDMPLLEVLTLNSIGAVELPDVSSLVELRSVDVDDANRIAGVSPCTVPAQSAMSSEKLNAPDRVR